MGEKETVWGLCMCLCVFFLSGSAFVCVCVCVCVCLCSKGACVSMRVSGRASRDVGLSDPVCARVQIENYHVWQPHLDEEDGAEGMRRAQAIVQRLRRRDLYTFVEEALIPPEALHSCVFPSSFCI